MAGAYNDLPARRMAHDLDGTRVFWAGGSLFNDVITELTATGDKEALNQDGNDTVIGSFGGLGHSTLWVYFMFPEKREWEGVCVTGYQGDGGGQYTAWYSTDATGPVSATYTQETSVVGTALPAMDSYRTQIHTVARSDVKAILVGFGEGTNSDKSSIGPIHFYGRPLPTTNPDRLIWIDPEDPEEDEYLLPKDWGDLERGGGPYPNVMKVRNNSSVYTATNIQISTEDLFVGDPAAFFTISLDGVDYGSVKTITSLAPGEQATIWIAATPPITYNPIGPNAARHYAVVSQWSIE